MQNQKITPEILQAIRDWYTKENLTYEEIAKKVTLKSPSISQWFNGQSDSIRLKSWTKLYPYIKPYLPEGYMINTGNVSARDNGIAVGNNMGNVRSLGNDDSEFMKLKDSMSQIESILENTDFTPEEMVKFIKHVIRKQKNT